MPKPLKVRHRAWLFWADRKPGAYFAHPSTLVLVSDRTGKVVRRSDGLWPLLVDGNAPPFLKSAKNYASHRYQVFARGRGLVRSAPHASAARLQRVFKEPTVAPPLPATPAAPATGPPGTGECMVLLRDRFDTLTFGGNVATERAFAARIGARVYDAKDGSGLDSDLSDAVAHGCTDAVIAIDAHGVAPGGTPLASALLRAEPEANRREPVIPGFDPPAGGKDVLRGEWFTSKNLREVMANPPGTGFKVIVDTCWAGRWIEDLRDMPPPNLKLIVASSRDDERSWASYERKDSDPFWKAIYNGTPPNVPPADVPKTIFDGVKTLYEPQAGRDPQHPQGLSADQGTFDGSDPQNETEVSGQLLPGQSPSASCGSVLELGVQGTFAPDNVWGTGSVAVSPVPPGGTGGPTAVANGYTAFASSTFAWVCGTPIGLTATPTRGMRFTGWSSPQGLCSGTVPTCTYRAPSAPAAPGAGSVRVGTAVTAQFTPALHQLTIENANLDGGVAEASGAVFPPLRCGTNYNGPTVTHYTQCSSPARASADDRDLRKFSFQPNPGDSTYGIPEYDVDRVEGCDVVTYAGHGASCILLLDTDRTVTVTWKLFRG